MIIFEHVTNSGGATRVPGDESRAAAAKVGDAMETRGLNDRGEGHRRQDGDEPPCEPHGEGPTQQVIWLVRPVSPSSAHVSKAAKSSEHLNRRSHARWPNHADPSATHNERAALMYLSY